MQEGFSCVKCKLFRCLLDGVHTTLSRAGDGDSPRAALSALAGRPVRGSGPFSGLSPWGESCSLGGRPRRFAVFSSGSTFLSWSGDFFTLSASTCGAGWAGTSPPIPGVTDCSGWRTGAGASCGLLYRFRDRGLRHSLSIPNRALARGLRACFQFVICHSLTSLF